MYLRVATPSPGDANISEGLKLSGSNALPCLVFWGHVMGQVRTQIAEPHERNNAIKIEPALQSEFEVEHWQHRLCSWHFVRIFAKRTSTGVRQLLRANSIFARQTESRSSTMETQVPTGTRFVQHVFLRPSLAQLRCRDGRPRERRHNQSVRLSPQPRGGVYTFLYTPLSPRVCKSLISR